MGKIIVGTDGSPGAGTALRWAVEEGHRRDWEVTALMAWSYIEQAHAGPGGRYDPDFSQTAIGERLDEAVVQAVGPDLASTVGRLVVCAPPTRALLDATADAELLVVGSRGLGGFRGLMLGSVSEQCLHHSTIPVAVVRPTGAPDRADDEPERVVVGVDGSRHAQAALHWAIDEARSREAVLELVHAWRSPITGFGPGALPWDPAEIEAEAQRIMTTALTEEEPVSLAHPIGYTVLSGPPAQVILEAAKGADLIVLGTRGRGGFGGLVLGSTSHQVARHADAPVVVVPGSRTA